MFWYTIQLLNMCVIPSHHPLLTYVPHLKCHTLITRAMSIRRHDTILSFNEVFTEELTREQKAFIHTLTRLSFSASSFFFWSSITEFVSFSACSSLFFSRSNTACNSKKSSHFHFYDKEEEILNNQISRTPSLIKPDTFLQAKKGSASWKATPDFKSRSPTSLSSFKVKLTNIFP